MKLVEWEFDTKTLSLVVHEAQYLGGSGTEVRHGKKWDLDKVKGIIESKVLSKHLTVLHSPE